MGTARVLLMTVAAVLVAAPGCGLLSGDDSDPSADDTDASGDQGGPPVEEPFDLIVVGDSFPEQSRDQLLALAGQQELNVAVTAFGGTAICDWWEQIDGYAEGEPQAVVLAFAGNDASCMTGGPDRPLASEEEGLSAEEAAGIYREDLETALDKLRPTGAELYVVLPPPVGEPFEERASAMRDMYRATQADHPDLTIIDSASYLDPDRKGFQAELPCEPWDDCPEGKGEIQVRDDDTIHLTPAGGERYARAVLEGIGLL